MWPYVLGAILVVVWLDHRIISAARVIAAAIREQTAALEKRRTGPD